MRKILFTLTLFIVRSGVLSAQFANTSVRWPTPEGGMIMDAYPLGYNFVAAITSNTNPVTDNSYTWSLVDMNGDGKPDLVVTAQAQGTNANPEQFGVATAPYWNVYLNNGTSFSSTPVTWSTPFGGASYGNLWGFNDITGISYGSDTGQLWNLTDMDGDGKPDLVVTGVWGGGQASQFSATSNPYWLVYLNTGTGFSSAAVTWLTPTGGFIVNGTDHLGYNVPLSIGSNNPSGGDASDSSQLWALVDVNGDKKPDLVITAKVDTSVSTQFNAGTNPYWQVYLNTGSGFSASPAIWPTPLGGTVENGANWGFNVTNGIAGNSYLFTGSEQWSLSDINGDGKPDLVVTSIQANVHGSVAQFNSTTSPYWQVYLNTGSGFAANPVTWHTPAAPIPLGDTLGFYNFGQAVGPAANQQQWSVVDMNNDGKPDLVLTGEESTGIGGSIITQFGAGNTPFWEVFLNTGTGFDTLGRFWFTPTGGSNDGQALGFDYISAISASDIFNLTTGETWSLTDIDGDGYPDLVIEATTGTGGNVEFNDSAGQFWKVFKNTFVTGIPAYKTNASVSLHPNPAGAGWNLEISDELAGGTAEIFDATGRELFKSILTGPHQFITLPGAAPGVYTLRITAGEYIEVKGLVKL